MKRLLSGIMAALLVGCQGVDVTTSDIERNNFVDAYKTWIVGVSTYDLMVKKYGEPQDRQDIEDGFAVRWRRTRRVLVTNERNDFGNPVKGFEASVRGPRSVVTVRSSMEAYYTKEGVLRSFRINPDE